MFFLVVLLAAMFFSVRDVLFGSRFLMVVF